MAVSSGSKKDFTPNVDTNTMCICIVYVYAQCVCVYISEGGEHENYIFGITQGRSG